MSAFTHLPLAQLGSFGIVTWLLGVAGLFLLVLIAVLGRFFRIWLQAYMSNADISIFELFGMSLRKVHLPTIVQSKIQAIKAGLTEISTQDLESHFLAGGRVINVVRALIAAHRANIDLNWKTATAIDLAGRDVLDAVQTSVNPKVIDCPSQTGARGTIDGVAKDGIQLKARARVTVRTNIKQLVGGATEETVVARVGEGIVNAIGSANDYKQVLEHPDMISKRTLERGLDAGTAFEILSIDIADIDVGQNVGAHLQAEQAEADKKMRQAEAEGRRAMAVAREQEMRAAVEENRAKVVLAEAEVPLAMAEAFRKGHLGVMDYYRMRNVQADSQMRESLARADGAAPPQPPPPMDVKKPPMP
ncbi:MAG: flotillin-like protein FloA [Phycisphaerae bacterium]|nr:flotillin-like protein FloA [Phycisphaerae bacterium]